MFRSISSIFKRKNKIAAEPIKLDEEQEPEEEQELEEEQKKEQEPEEPKEQLLDAKLIEVIPQIDGTCWFNGVLMALLYSQGIRQVIIQEVARWTPEEIRDDKFKGFVVYVLKYNYKDPAKIRELFKRRFKTSSLLLSLLKKTPSLIKIKENIQLKLTKNTRNLSYSTIDFLLHNNFLNIFFKNTNDYLSIYYSQYKYLYYINNNNIHIKPKIIFLYHHEILREEIINMIEGEQELSNVYDRVSYSMFFCKLYYY